MSCVNKTTNDMDEDIIIDNKSYKHLVLLYDVTQISESSKGIRVDVKAVNGMIR